MAIQCQRVIDELLKNAPIMNERLRVLALGDIDSDELRDVVQQIASAECATLDVTPTSTSNGYHLVILLQLRPGAVEASLVQQLRQTYPLAGLIMVLGTWCEGETRTGRAVPHCERVFWYQFPAWWQQSCAAWQTGRPTSWQQSAPAKSDTQAACQGLIAVDSPDAEAAEVLIEACHSLGASAVWSPRWRPRPLGTEPMAGIWVGGQLEAFEEPHLVDFRRSLSQGSPLVALLDFPRRDRVSRAIELGATSVLGKPWRLDQLAANFDAGF